MGTSILYPLSLILLECSQTTPHPAKGLADPLNPAVLAGKRIREETLRLPDDDIGVCGT